jgi:hypothetical protein
VQVFVDQRLDTASNRGQVHAEHRPSNHAPQELAEIREKAVASEGVLVVDMPNIAQTNRVYDEYLAEPAETKPEDLATCAISVIGPRNKISKLVKRLNLMP